MSEEDANVSQGTRMVNKSKYGDVSYALNQNEEDPSSR